MSSLSSMRILVQRGVGVAQNKRLANNTKTIRSVICTTGRRWYNSSVSLHSIQLCGEKRRELQSPRLLVLDGSRQLSSSYGWEREYERGGGVVSGGDGIGTKTRRRIPKGYREDISRQLSIVSCAGTNMNRRSFSTTRIIRDNQLEDGIVSSKLNQTTTTTTSKSSIGSTSNTTRETKDEPTFEEMDIHPNSKRAIKDVLKLTTMTEIQSKTFHAAASGKDVLGRARTGTGKTLAFLLPALETVLRNDSNNNNDDDDDDNNRHDGNHGIPILVISPTRELAMQINEQGRILLSAHNFTSNGSTSSTTDKHEHRYTSQVMVGGSSKRQDVRKLEKRLPTILVTTPGRLRDHIDHTVLNLTESQTQNQAESQTQKQSFASILKSTTKTLILDETDRLLDMGFRTEINHIITKALPPKQHRQTLLFSATLPPEVRNVLSQTMKNDYLTVDCIHDADPATHTNHNVKQSHIVLPHLTHQLSGVVRIVLETIYNHPDNHYKLVCFFPTTNLVSFYSDLFNFHLLHHLPSSFSEHPIAKVIELHSRKTQSYRTSASNRFREVKRGILFTSDVSARGVDYPDVTHVLQFGMADGRETYIHRLGRTGRAEKKGEGILVLSDVEAPGFFRCLHGLHVPPLQDWQVDIDTDTDQNQNHGWQIHLQEVLRSIVESVQNGSNPRLQNAAEEAYRSMLGYYSAKLPQIGVRSKKKLVQKVNAFAEQCGLVQPPLISPKIARNMGLDAIEGIRIGSTTRASSSSDGNKGETRARNSKIGGRNKNSRSRGEMRTGGNNGSSNGNNNRGKRYTRSKSGRRGEYGGGSITGEGSYDDWGRGFGNTNN